MFSDEDSLSVCSFGSRADLNRLGEAPVPSWIQVAVPVQVLFSTGGSKTGTVQFIGQTEFASGNWIGVELDQAEGRFFYRGHIQRHHWHCFYMEALHSDVRRPWEHLTSMTALCTYRSVLHRQFLLLLLKVKTMARCMAFATSSVAVVTASSCVTTS